MCPSTEQTKNALLTNYVQTTVQNGYFNKTTNIFMIKMFLLTYKYLPSLLRNQVRTNNMQIVMINIHYLSISLPDNYD